MMSNYRFIVCEFVSVEINFLLSSKFKNEYV